MTLNIWFIRMLFPSRSRVTLRTGLTRSNMWPLVTTPRIWMSLTMLLDWLQNDSYGFEYSLAQFYVFKVDFGLLCTKHLKRKGWLPLGRNKGSCLLSYSLKVVSRNRPCEEQSLFIKIFHCLFDIVNSNSLNIIAHIMSNRISVMNVHGFNNCPWHRCDSLGYWHGS